jgi:hypothetical protein
MAKAILKAGARFKSAVSDAQVMIVKAPAGEFELGCGGVAMVGGTASLPEGATLAAGDAGEVLIGKRYVNADESLEMLCTKGGRVRKAARSTTVTPSRGVISLA